MRKNLIKYEKGIDLLQITPLTSIYKKWAS